MTDELNPAARKFLESARAGQMRAPAGMQERVRSAIGDASLQSNVRPHRLAKIWLSSALVVVGGAVGAYRVTRQPVPEAPRSAPASAVTRVPDRAQSPGTTGADELRLEMAWLGRAEAALRRDDPQAALSVLQAERARFEHGQLQSERQGLELIAACRLGHDVSAGLERYLASTGQGVLVARVREACDSRRRGAK